MKTITKNGYEITVVDSSAYYNLKLVRAMVDVESLAKRIFKGIKFQQSLKNKKPRD